MNKELPERKRNRRDYEEHVKYIYNNPRHWYLDELYYE